MENSPTPAQPLGTAAGKQRTVALRHAAILVDESRLQRIAQFTDGTARGVEMQWSEVKRVAAFRRDVLTEPVLCVAISDPAKIVVLDESMEGWQPLLEAIPRHLTESPTFAAWREGIGHESTESHWAVLFSSEQ
jgi:hypothetical protein